MTKDKKYQVIVAETSPVISSGFTQCFKKIGLGQIDVTEVATTEDLKECLMKGTPDFILVNPTFGGSFNPQKVREQYQNSNLKIIGIETGKLSKQVNALYDETLHVSDDLETIKSKVKALFIDKDENIEEKESLSAREKEIISLVVRGMTNQEIADKLFLSIHTVITHRRNIARKLEIHSATGLTIYAIVNKLVNIEDVIH